MMITIFNLFVREQDKKSYIGNLIKNCFESEIRNSSFLLKQCMILEYVEGRKGAVYARQQERCRL